MGNDVRDFRSLQVWRKAHELTLEVYRSMANFPREEVYGLTSQMRRASSSIPANIAEGCGRDGSVELARFCRIASGSASELEYHLFLAHELGLLNSEGHDRLSTEVMEVKRMLPSFIQKLTAES